MKEIKCGIYKITNLKNNLCYIGESIDIDRRQKEHKAMKYKATIYDAFKLYGIDNFSFEIIELCDKTELFEKEKYWISYYNSYKKGYNMTPGGEGGYTGKHCRQVVQYDLDGNFLTIYDSISEAERCLGVKSSGIIKVCKGEAYEACNYQWKYLNEEENYKLNIGKSLRHEKCQEGAYKCLQNRVITVQKVAKCDKKTHKIIKEYDSVKEASVENNIHFSNIYRTCKGERKSAGGYYWIYINNNNK